MELHTKIYARVNLFKCLDFEFPKSEKSFISEQLENGLFDQFYKKIVESDDYVLIESRFILNKCILVKDFLTEVKYDFEHD